MGAPYQGDSAERNQAGLVGTNAAGGDAVWGESDQGRGVVGVSKGAGGVGVWGVTGGGRGIVGVVDRGRLDDKGHVHEGPAVDRLGGGGDDAGAIGGRIGGSHAGQIVFGGDTVEGIDHPGSALELLLEAARGDDVGVWGETRYGRGVVGAVTEPGGAGVWGATRDGRSVVGVDSGVGTGVWGETARGRAVVGVAGGHGTGVYGEQRGEGGFAGYFVGDVHVTRNLSVATDIVLVNADCAEDFDVEVDPLAATDEVEPGTVMVVGRHGALRPCADAYDRRVVGVVSGAGSYRSALVLDRSRPTPGRLPVALIGKVYCKVDATAQPVGIGDLLTSSARPGHAMKASDPTRSFGAVIGKALADLHSGLGLVPILIALQ